jgi:hypothetical protein
MLYFFHLEDTFTLTVTTTNGGKVQLNSLSLDQFPWKGIYFMGLPIQFTAVASVNYKFSGWKHLKDQHISFTTTFSSDTTITALFDPIPLSLLYDSIIFNEIGFHIAKEKDAGDWIELLNISSNDIDMSGWLFKDSKDEHSFYLPNQLILKPGQYIVLCNNLEGFEQKYPNVLNVVGNFSFGLNNKKESLRLFDKDGNFVDSLTYNTLLINDSIPITEISVSDPFGPNYKMNNWIVSKKTPGSMNEALLHKIQEEERNKKLAQEKWNRYRLYATIASIILLLIGLLLYLNERRKTKIALK